MTPYPRARTAQLSTFQRSEPEQAQASEIRVTITLTSEAQNHVLRHGLRPRLAVLMQRAEAFERMMMAGDRVALSDTPSLDLHVLRRRLLVDARESTLEIVLDVTYGS